MMNITVNIKKNTEHYNDVYSHVNINTIINKVENIETFLDRSIKTDTSWHGLYQGNFIEELSGKRILELGCGDGLNALIMAKLGGEVTAIDISDQSKHIIDAANRVLDLPVSSITGDFLTISFDPHSFDLVVGKAFLHHLTHELENKYLEKVSLILKSSGEVRFLEPAINSKWLDKLRWIIPVPGRPSILNKRAYRVWKANDPHPVRDNSTQHFVEVGNSYFKSVETVMIGSLERLCRLLPPGKFNTEYRRWAHRIEPHLPAWFRNAAARSQLIIYKNPKKKK